MAFLNTIVAFLEQVTLALSENGEMIMMMGCLNEIWDNFGKILRARVAAAIVATVAAIVNSMAVNYTADYTTLRTYYHSFIYHSSPSQTIIDSSMHSSLDLNSSSSTTIKSFLFFQLNMVIIDYLAKIVAIIPCIQHYRRSQTFSVSRFFAMLMCSFPVILLL